MSVLFSIFAVFAVTLLVLFTFSALLPLAGAWLLAAAGRAVGAPAWWIGTTVLFGLVLFTVGLLDSFLLQSGLVTKLLILLGAWALVSLPALLAKRSSKEEKSGRRPVSANHASVKG